LDLNKRYISFKP